MAAHRLVLIRHAKTGEGAVDIDRALTARGHRNAAAIGTALADADLVPDLVVVSPALRARETWHDAAVVLGWTDDVTIDPRIYDNDPNELVAIVQETPAQVATLVLVGHNPSFQEFAYALDDGTGPDSARELMVDGFPTAGVAVFDLIGEWTGIEGGAVLQSFVVPR